MAGLDQHAAHVSEELLEHYYQQEGLLALNTEWPNQQLYRVLGLSLNRPCACSCETFGQGSQDRGINAWVEITKDHLGAKGQGMAGLVARVFNPKRAGKYADAMQFFAGWESAV